MTAGRRHYVVDRQYQQGMLGGNDMKSGFFDASFSNKAVALETDQTDTASLRHRRPRIFAALLLASVSS